MDDLQAQLITEANLKEKSLKDQIDQVVSVEVIEDESQLMGFFTYLLDLEQGDSEEAPEENNSVEKPEENNPDEKEDADDKLINKLYESVPSFRILCDLFRGKHPLTVITENQYVDRYYRDSYYMHYASKHLRYRRFCKRVSFFKGNMEKYCTCKLGHFKESVLNEHFMGSVVVRPLPQGKLGRTLLNPRYFLNDNETAYIRCTDYHIGVAGMCLSVKAFPYSMQDGETTTCAETTILNLLDFFSRKYPDYKIALPSDISAIVDRNGYERSLPSRGMRYSEISKVISELGFFPRLYASNMYANNVNQLRRIMHYYIESGIPVAIGLKKQLIPSLHSVICVGHRQIKQTRPYRKAHLRISDEGNKELWIIDTADMCDSYVVMDDGEVPYKIFSWTEQQGKTLLSSSEYSFGNAELTTVLVPLYRRMFLEAEDAFQICWEYLKNSDQIAGFDGFGIDGEKEWGTSEDNPLVVRLFLASGKHFREIRVKNFVETNDDSLQYYTSILLPRYVWVCELYTLDDYQQDKPKAIGEIVIDATASKDGKNQVLLFRYANFISLLSDINLEDESEDGDFEGLKMSEREFIQLKKCDRINAYSHNLEAVQKDVDNTDDI